jgi:hypothetical protein
VIKSVKAAIVMFALLMACGCDRRASSPAPSTAEPHRDQHEWDPFPPLPPTATTQPVDYSSLTRALESRDVAADLKEALAHGDSRFMGVMGIGLIVPGVPDYYKKHKGSRGVRVIPYTSDAIGSEAEQRLQSAAHRYAENYNRLLLASIAQAQPQK